MGRENRRVIIINEMGTFSHKQNDNKYLVQQQLLVVVGLAGTGWDGLQTINFAKIVFSRSHTIVPSVSPVYTIRT